MLKGVKTLKSQSIVKKSASTKTRIKVDETSGSMAYNRLDMQVSQALCMAIELYDSLDYLFVMDHYDDITIFDISQEPFIVSYYQMKTHERSITLNTVLSEDWFAKLYAQLQRPEWIIKELGLITNCQLDVNVEFKDSNGKTKHLRKQYNEPKTAFCSMPIMAIDKIKNDIATKLNMPVENVDLSKFVHMRTVLTIAKHRDIAEGELSKFLQKKYSQIKVETVKAIFGSMFRLLSDRQEFEGLAENSNFENVARYKGVYKKELTRIIDDALLISMPPVRDVIAAAKCQTKKEENILSLAYVHVLSDQQSKPESYKEIVYKVKVAIDRERFSQNDSITDYTKRICDIVHGDNSTYSLLYDGEYIKVMTICILLNEMRNLDV